MNTHLHLMEAYTTLYQVWPDNTVATKLHELIENFLQFIIDPSTHHFKLFFDEFWHSKSQSISFGHDIEGSWLICEAAEALGDQKLIKKIKKKALDMVDITIQKGCSKRYSIIQEQYGDGTIDQSVHWWQQAEALVGLVNAFQISNDERYLHYAFNCWQFIDEYLVDKHHGEWFYEISPDGRPNLNQDKVSEWKGPYHNGRACMEILKRLGKPTGKSLSD